MVRLASLVLNWEARSRPRFPGCCRQQIAVAVAVDVFAHAADVQVADSDQAPQRALASQARFRQA
jgi:hypothetical protein